MSPQLHRLSTWFVLVVALFAAVPPAAGMVVCLGDGHVDLGDVDESCPCDHGGEKQGADEHGPCHDVVVDPFETSFDSASLRVVFDADIAPAPLIFAAHVRAQCMTGAACSVALAPPDMGPRRSVVLLI